MRVIMNGQIVEGKFANHNTKWTQTEEAILGASLNHLCFADIAGLLPGRTVEAVKQRATILGLVRSGKRFPKRRLNEHFFASGSNVTAAYWAGFLAADGCVSTTSRREVRLSIHPKDRSHLEAFVLACGYDGPIWEKPQPICGVTICAADKWIEDLQRNYNIGPRKTKTLEPPNISGDAALAYTVGYIDGDGCWHIDSRGTLRLVVVGTAPFLTWMNDLWSANGASVGQTNNRLVRGIYRRSWAGRYARSIAETLMSLDVPFMDRKWSVAKKGVEGTPCHSA